MAKKASDILRVAADEIGYLEKASNASLDSKTANAGSKNYTKYGAWYGLNGPDAFWCHMFISWCAEKAGCASIVPRTASCYKGKEWFQEHGRFHLRAAYTPKPGDIVYFSTNQYPYGGGHVGIVEKVENGRVYTIEGNTSGASGVVENGGGVARKSYPLGYTSIYGYGHPKYESEDEEMTQEQFNAMYEKVNPAYTSIEQVPKYWQEETRALMQVGAIQGDGKNKISIRQEELQAAVIAYRAAIAVAK